MLNSYGPDKYRHTDMAQIMARENMTEFSHDALTEVESVRSILEAYGHGELPDFPKPPKNANRMMYADSKVPPRGGSFPYTVVTVADFLGWDFPNRTDTFCFYK